jgi:hypothetical protein
MRKKGSLADDSLDSRVREVDRSSLLLAGVLAQAKSRVLSRYPVCTNLGLPISPLSAGLAVVVEHYDAFLELELTVEEKADLVEFLKSI